MKDLGIVNVRDLEMELKKPFPFKEIEWRVGSSFERNGEVKALALPYVTSRAIMDRLDEVFGLDGWSDEYKAWGNTAQLCGITVKIGENTITKWDGADSTDIESVKGGLSNALKRTAVKFGIGRYLYSFDPIWVRCEVKGRSKVIAKEEFDTTLANFYKNQLSKIYGADIVSKTVGVHNNAVNQQVRENSSNYNNNNQYQNKGNGFNSNVARGNEYNSTIEVFSGNSTKVENSINNNTKKVMGYSEMTQPNNSTKGLGFEKKGTSQVPGAFLNFIRSRIQATGKDINSICKYYNINDLEELDMAQANDLVSKLN